MAEPRDMKGEEGETKPLKKRMYLRLGYTRNPRDKRLLVPETKTKPKLDRQGGKKKCKERPRIISVETIVGEAQTTDEIAERGRKIGTCCASNCGEGHCCE